MTKPAATVEIEAKRDPRTDPKPGDILRWHGRERHVVGDSWPRGDVYYREVIHNARRIPRVHCSLRTWRRWATRPDTEIVQIGWRSSAN